MAGNYVPSAGSSFSGACIPGSEGKPVWLTLVTVGTCGMARAHPSNASGAGTPFITLIGSPLQTVGPKGPYISSSGIYIEAPSGTGASVYGWLKK